MKSETGDKKTTWQIYLYQKKLNTFWTMYTLPDLLWMLSVRS